MKFRKICLALALCVGFMNAQSLKIGTNANFPPFEFIDKEMQIVGFEIDLVAEISKRVGFEYTLTDMGFDGLIPALKSGKIDMVASGMSATDERKKAVDFTKSFFFTENVYLKRKDDDSIKSKADLNGKAVSAQIGTIQEMSVNAMEGAKPSIVQDPVMAIVALENGKVSAVVLDSFVAYSFLKERPNLAEFLKEPDGSEGFSFAFDKDKHKDLIAKIDKAIDDIKSDGTYDKLLEKYDMKSK